MAWTYNTSTLATSEKDQVRLEIGDTDSTAPLLQDEEINRAIAVERNFWGAAARCCEIISRTFLRKADVRVGRGGTTLTYSTAAKQFTDMARALRLKANGTVVPWAGGMVLDDKIALSENTGAVQPIFAKGTQNNPWVGGQTADSVVDETQNQGR